MAESTQVDITSATQILGCWKVGMTPAKTLTVLGGTIPIPKPNFFVHHQRRIVIEVRRKWDQEDSTSRENNQDGKALGEEDEVFFCIQKPKKMNLNDTSNAEDSDDSENEPSEEDDSEGDSKGQDTIAESWTEHYRYPISALTLTSIKDNRIDLELGIGGNKEERDMEFVSEKEANEFDALWNDLLKRAKERATRQLQDFQERLEGEEGTKKDKAAADDLLKEDAEVIMENSVAASESTDDDDTGDEANTTAKIQLLIDIVSGSNLPISDTLEGTSDPFVVVQMNGKDLHKTRYVSNDCDPIWTIQQKSLCLIELPAKDFMLANAMTFVVKDHDTLNSDDTLGYVKVSCEEMLEGTGERKEYTLDTYNDGKKDKKDEGVPPKLYLRFKKATKDDIEFMKVYETHGDSYGVFADEVYLPMQKRCNNMFKKMHKKDDEGTKLTRAIPFPDPERDTKDTKFMTSDDIQEEALKDSTNWVQAGSGNIGTLFFELIGCDDLPTMDTLTPGSIDPFACIVYEDSIVNTDVIENCNSPRWMPWTYRAFKFQMAHPSTDVMLGIFDRDSAYDPAQLVARVAHVSNLHDAAGRVVIELSKLQPNTTYLLKYPIYYGETKEQRQESRGTVTVRLRMDFPSVRKALLAALSPPKNNVIALRSKSHWSVAHYTTEGAIDDEAFSIATMTRYLAELQEYLNLIEVIKGALLFVVMWRNHYTLTLGAKKIELPLHSITAYYWGIKLSWNYDLLPSFLFFSVGWAMLACQEQVNRHPSKWNQSPSYFEFLRRLVLDSSSSETVEAGKDAEIIQEYEKQQEEERARRKKRQREEQAKHLQIQKEVNAKMEQAEKAESSGFDNGGGFLGLGLELNSPLKPILYPYQKMMQGYVQKTRLAKNIILWYESYLAFWVTTLAFGASVATYYVPWGFLLKWAIRATIIVCLGPWMIIVDRKIFGYDPNKSIKEQEEEFKERMKNHYKQRIKSTNIYQIQAERGKKLSDMRQFMFGKHLVKVPVLHEDLFFDVPSPGSSAKPFTAGKTSLAQIKEHKFGQSLQGDMIPQRECQVCHEKAKTGKGVRKMLAKNGTCAFNMAGNVAKEAPMKAISGVMKTGKKVADRCGDIRTPLLQQQASNESSALESEESK